MITQKFEIKVALLGYVSVGKTTVLNATLRDKFSEVSMRRTTAGINFFRIVSPTVNAPVKHDTDGGCQWSVAGDQETQKAPAVLREIETANQVLRETGVIEEKWFNIELEEPLCEMRKDTSLVLVDIPGINEADTDSIYTRYVDDNWKSFDCVVAVMDARQGVNTEEQLALLHLIKKNLSFKKEIPTIILFNKVDEPDNTEQVMLVKEAQEKISKIFEVGCRKASLQRVLDPTGNSGSISTDVYPVFIATSAVHAFFYRAASLLTFDQFRKNFDMDLIDMIGREEVGRFRWKKLSPDQRYEAVYKAVCEDESYKERLEDTNFDTYLTALSFALGGTAVQTKILEKQVDVELESLLGGETVNVGLLRALYDKSMVLNKNLTDIKDTFWSVYMASRETALEALDEDGDILDLAELVQTLGSYCSFVQPLQWKDEEERVHKEACSLVRLQFELLLRKPNLKECWELSRQICGGCASSQDTAEQSTWDSLSLHDWLAIFDSILLLSYDRTFCEVFGREKILLSQLRYRFVSSLSAPVACSCKICQPDLQCYDNNYNIMRSVTTASNIPKPKCCKCNNQLPLSPCRKAAHDPLVEWELCFATGSVNQINDQLNIFIPDSLSSPSHWGHVAWKCCKLVDALDTAAA